MAKPAEFIGRRFGRLTVIGHADRTGLRSKKRRWVCRCDCGGTSKVFTTNLTNNSTQSCGCLHSERASKRLRQQATTHGLTGSPEYVVWHNMKQRCLNPRHPQFRNYGGRGIAIWRPWISSIEAFIRDVGPRPSPNHSLDRFPNNDGNYEPQNVRWATSTEQANNMRPNTLLNTGETIHEAARRLGVPYGRLRSRLQMGWTESVAMSTPKKNNRWWRNQIVFSTGETVREASERTGVPGRTIRSRLAKGWSEERALKKPSR